MNVCREGRRTYSQGAKASSKPVATPEVFDGGVKFLRLVCDAVRLFLLDHEHDAICTVGDDPVELIQCPRRR